MDRLDGFAGKKQLPPSGYIAAFFETMTAGLSILPPTVPGHDLVIAVAPTNLSPQIKASAK